MINSDIKNVVIIGGGFAGLNAAISLSKSPVNITLIDKRNFHLFQPLLYQVASGALSPADISFPLRAIFKNKNNVRIIQQKVTDVNISKKIVITENNKFSYDYLILATGAQTHYFGKTEWSKITYGLKYIEDATSIRNQILTSYESAEIEADPIKKSKLLTFAIIGGGPAGVEMAGAIAELANNTLHCDFRNIDPKNSKILLIEGGKRILPAYPEELSKKAEESLKGLGVKILTNHFVKNINDDDIELLNNDQLKTISAKTKIWTAGVKAETFISSFAKNNNLETDKGGRVLVNQYCKTENINNIFVIGDIANFKDGKGISLPGIAPVAMQQGKYVAKYIVNEINNKNNIPFKYFDKGNLAVIGRKAAVGFRNKIKLSGFIAWLTWLFVHLLYLVGFENRVLVAVQWAFNYFTFNRSARLIANKTKIE